jgi:hypothetical protein
LPDDDRLFRRVHDLLVDGNARPELDSEWDQNTRTNSTSCSITDRTALFTEEFRF